MDKYGLLKLRDSEVLSNQPPHLTEDNVVIANSTDVSTSTAAVDGGGGGDGSLNNSAPDATPVSSASEGMVSSSEDGSDAAQPIGSATPTSFLLLHRLPRCMRPHMPE